MKIALVTIHLLSGFDNVVRMAHHLLLMSITPAKLGELCPNTRGLEKTLRFLMLKVHEASMFVVSLDRIDNTHCYFKVTDDFKVSVKFYSIKCGFSFKITLSYKSGFGACRYFTSNVINSRVILLLLSKTVRAENGCQVCFCNLFQLQSVNGGSL